MAHFNYVELPARDLPAARTFYREAFGFQFADFGPSYSSTVEGGVNLGLQGDAAEACAAPLAVIAVDDLDAAQARLIAAGGRISRAIFAFPGGRRFHFLDPHGNELAVVQTD